MPCLRPADSESFGVFLSYYTQREEISQNKLAECARINQSYLNKIANGRINDVPVNTLVSICLALRLSLDEAKDLLARRERAFSPANKAHKVYMELINEYHKREVNYKDCYAVASFLLDADRRLQSEGFPTLPNFYKG